MKIWPKSSLFSQNSISVGLSDGRRSVRNFVAYEEKEPYVDNLYDFKLTFAHTLKGCSFPQTPPSHRGCSAALTVRAQQVLGEFFFRAKNGDELMMIMTML